MTADTLASLLLARAEDDRPGLVYEGRVWSWREHVAACRAAGDRLSARGAGTHVGVLSENVPELVVLIGGAALAGHVVVALNPTRSVDELIRDARATDVDLVLADGSCGGIARAVSEALGVTALPLASEAPCAAPRTAAREAVPEGAVRAAGAGPDPGGLVMLIFTSGTSGRPRAVRITQRKLAVPGSSLAALLTPDDAVYCSMPLFHSGALMAAYAPAVASGAALVVRQRFSASGLLPDIRRYGCTYLHYVGKALSYVLATPEQPGDADNPLRIAFGNEGSAVAVRRFGERFGCLVIDAFGSTETAISLTPTPPGRRAASAACPRACGSSTRSPPGPARPRGSRTAACSTRTRPSASWSTRAGSACSRGTTTTRTPTPSGSGTARSGPATWPTRTPAATSSSPAGAPSGCAWTARTWRSRPSRRRCGSSAGWWRRRCTRCPTRRPATRSWPHSSWKAPPVRRPPP
ncbi:AMP-binding protein [Nonomuraea thailandensis]